MNKEYSRENIERVKSFLEKELWEYHFIELLSVADFMSCHQTALMSCL